MSALLQCSKERLTWRDGLSGNKTVFAVEREALRVERCSYNAKREAISEIWLFSFSLHVFLFHVFSLHASHFTLHVFPLHAQ